MNIPFSLCKNYITPEKASFLAKRPSLISNNYDAEQNEQSNESQENENSISNSLEIIDYPYYLNYNEKEAFPFNTHKLGSQNYKEFDDITEDILSPDLIKDIIRKKSEKQKSKTKELDSSSSFKKNNKTIYRKALKNKKIINKNNSPTNKSSNIEKVLNHKISKKTNSNKMVKSKIEVAGIQINCPSPDSDKNILINHIYKYNSQFPSKNTKKAFNSINYSNSNQKTGKLKITSNFADFNKNKQKEKKDKKDQKETNLNLEKISKNKNRTYNTLTISNKERILLKIKKFDKINNNDESNRSQKVKCSIEKKKINNDEFKNKKILNIIPILKTGKSSDCLGRNKTKQHILYVNHNKYHKINKIKFNNNYNTIHIINSQRNKKNNTVLNHLLKIQNINYFSKTYINPFDEKEKRVIKNLKNINLNKAKKH